MEKKLLKAADLALAVDTFVVPVLNVVLDLIAFVVVVVVEDTARFLTPATALGRNLAGK